MTSRPELMRGSSESLLLCLIGQKPMYGYQISQELCQRSGGYFEMKEGLLYPTLHRMAQEGLLASEWRETGTNRRRKYYAITDKGHRALREQTTEWQTFTNKFFHLLGAPAEAGKTS